MRKPFIHADFLLNTDAGRALYHQFAEPWPIIDYHCHLPPADVAADRRFENLFQIWLAGDHYKWRAMRTHGVPERYCTGDAPEREKFNRWAETAPYTLGNPLYHWTHLELARPFGITDLLLGPDTADRVWEIGRRRLAEPEFSARGIMRQMQVRLVCTTDDPADDLAAHQAIRADTSFDIQVRPTFRPDKALAIEQPAAFKDWIGKLATAADQPVRSFPELLAALEARLDFFHAQGCRLSDHGLETVYGEPADANVCDRIFRAALAGQAPAAAEADGYKAALLLACGRWYAARNWTMQLHVGAQRNNNSRRFAELGPDTGFDSIGDACYARPLARLLDQLDATGELPRTILYNLNPKDNEVLATMCGNFQSADNPGKIQFGSGWWFLDQRDGMLKQLHALAALGLLRHMVGMLTDSRSFLSYTRHEYFRRILCAWLGEQIEQGLLPDDLDLVGALVADVCYRNAARYFGFSGLPEL
ncbi:MAG: glucuronate isomerase [Candidatus Marinimicrobia bacterium]|nr:glucuronate isomerase [Candidatus Neomarinimicrobiota bacterium]